MSDYGIKISLPGFDVDTATPEQCALHSAYACPKVKLNQTPAHFGTYTHTFGSNPADGVTVLKSVVHGLGYKPMHFVLIKDTVGGDTITLPLPGAYGTANQIYARSTTTTLNISLQRAPGTAAIEDLTGVVFVFKYYIFVENGA
jgi:hypothetical protein